MLLMIDNYDSFTYNLVQYLGELGEEVRVVRNDALTVDEVAALRPDRIVISPGPCSPNEAGISVPVIQRLAGTLPILGVCLGHQSIGAALGGAIVRADRIMHGKTSPIRHDGRTIFTGLSNPFDATRYHSLLIERATLPECLEISAWTDEGEIMGVRHREYLLEGVQFHPESILTVEGKRLLKNFLERLEGVKPCPCPNEPDPHFIRAGTRTGRDMDIKSAIAQLTARRNLSEADMEGVVRDIMGGHATPAQIGGFLVALSMKGEQVDEIAGAARAMRRYATRVPTQREVVDTCGTGGDRCNTFNISTAAAFVAAGAGLVIAKHGNRAMSGTVGGADVLEALGIRIDLDPEQVAACLEEVGIGFLFAQRFHPAMRHVAAPRREIGVRTIFNLLGPLTNPAGARAQLLGVFAREWVEPLAHALGRLGSPRAMVVHGDDGLDELSLTGPSLVAELRDGAVHTYRFDPSDVGLARCAPSDLAGGDVERNAQILRDIFRGRAAAAQTDIALLNAAAVLYVGGKADSIAAGLHAARAAVDSGAAAGKLEALIEATNR